MKNITFTLILALVLAIPVFGQTSYTPRIFIKKCKKYLGTPYRFGGNDKKGIDCSGLIYNVFDDLDVQFPRNSTKQAEVFKEVKMRKIRKGDLVYFTTNGKNINHTGVVVRKLGAGNIVFLHASTSNGVRMDKLNSKYWSDKFVKATRPLKYKSNTTNYAKR